MMKNSSKKRKVTVLVIMIILLSVVFTGFNSAVLANVRNVDIAKIFACGVLTGVLITTVKDIVWERKES